MPGREDEGATGGQSPSGEGKPDAKILNLEAELFKVREELAKFKISETKTVFISRDRKLQKFSGRPIKETDPQVEDWIEDASYHIKNISGKEAQLEFLFDHLQGQAKDEVRVLPEKDRNTPGKILDILRVLFQDVDTVAQIQQGFYQRVQRPGESLQQYSLALLKLMDKLIKKERGVIGDKDLMLKERFIDGVRDQQLKREMRRFSLDHSGVTFSDFRAVVLKWCEDEAKVSLEPVHTNEIEQLEVSAIKSNSGQADLMKLIQNQQELLEKQQRQLDHLSQVLTTTNASSNQASQFAPGTHRRPWNRGGFSGRRGGGRGACYRCGSRDHYIRDCKETAVKEGSMVEGCPKGWVYSSPNCYKFVQDSQLIFEEAAAACTNYGATLLGVDTYAEHKFVSDWLKRNDILPPSIWLTSGLIKQNMLIWEVALPTPHTAETYWNHPVNEDTEGRVAYKFGGHEFNKQYGWTNVSASIPYYYICEIPQSEAAQMDIQHRGEDYGYGIVDPKDLPRGPSLITEPFNMIVVAGELSVYLECTSGGNPYPSFKFFKIIEDVEVEVTSEMDSRYTLSSGRLTIEDPEIKDIGYYQCRATNEHGTVLSKFAQIQFGYLSEFPPVEPNDIEAKAFRGIRVDCNTPQFFPEVRFEWSKFGTAAWLFPGGSYTFVSQAGYMYFSELQPTDQKEYFCFVTLSAPRNYKMNTKQPPMRISKGVWLIVIHQTDATAFGPDIKTHAFPSPALRGLTLRLECIAYGTLPISYRWRRKDGRPFVSGTRIHDRNRVLQVDNAPLSAEGEYICTAIGKNGVAEKTLTVVMEATPYFPYSIGDMFVDPGQSLKWRCMAVARPKATYVWYKDGKVIKAVQGTIDIIGTTLYISSIDKDRDEGMYQCSATNVHGTTFSTGRLKVLSFKPNFDKHPLPPTTLAPVGGNISIPCMVEAAPVPTINWLKNGGNLGLMPGDTSGRIGMTTNFDLVLTEISYSDAGTYICEAENINGKAQNLTLVKVVEGVTITTAPIPTMVMINETAFLYCHASYNYLYDVTYQWRFNGHLIDYHLNPEYKLGQNLGVYGLYIIQAQFEHQGLYECTALTTLHRDSRTARLTVTGPPGPPAGVYVQELSVSSYSARLVWTVGVETDHGNPITSYDIEAETDYHPGDWEVLMTDIPEITVAAEAINEGKRTDQRSFVVQGLIPYTGYSFRVRAINGFGRGKMASKPSVRIQTPKEAPVIAPKDVSGGGGRVGTLQITWQPLDIAEHSGPNLGYNVYWKLHDDKNQGWKKDKILDRYAKRYFEDNAETVERMMFTYTVGSDNYYLQYDVKVGCYNDIGDGPNSTVSIIYSAEGMPVARPVMQDNPELNATAVYVKWIPVPDDRENMKGRVGGYTVQYFKRVDMFMPFEGYDPDYIKQKEVYGQKDYVLIIGLKPVTEYFARVQVWNSAGRGPKGEWRRSETRHAAPHDYPTFVEVHPDTEHSVIVKWRGISTHFNEESLEGYIVRVWKIQEDIRTATDTKVDKITWARVTGLQRHTVYVLRVLGFSWGGEGQKSETTYFTVLGGNIPFDPSTSEICYRDGEGQDNCDGAVTLRCSILLLLLLSSTAKLVASLT